MTERQFDNGSGAKFFPTASRTTLTALVTNTGLKTSGFGFQTSAKFNAAIALISAMRTALLAAGIGV